jgi:hypothetical protein
MSKKKLVTELLSAITGYPVTRRYQTQLQALRKYLAQPKE